MASIVDIKAVSYDVCGSMQIVGPGNKAKSICFSPPWGVRENTCILNSCAVEWYVKRMKTVSKKFDRFLEHVLDEHNNRRIAAGENFEAKDMVDLLLQLADDPNLDVKLERHGVKAFTQVGDGKEEYTDADIDEIREEWAFYVSNFILP